MSNLVCRVCGKEVTVGIWDLCEECCDKVVIRKVSGVEKLNE